MAELMSENQKRCTEETNQNLETLVEKDKHSEWDDPA